jgi:signal transduction histidine kinase/CheY-like chemotaxis protein
VTAYDSAVAERAQFRARARVRDAAGDWRWIEAHATPRIGPRGELLGYVGVSPDVTELLQAQDALRAADQRKDQFLAMLAHELRNPLAPIRTASEILTMPNLSDDQLSWSCRVIHRQVDHMARLLDDLLDVARITRGKLQLKKQRVELGTIVETAVEAARPLIEARKHRLTIELPSSLPTLDADPVRLAQVLSNLLTNAAKYTDPPGRILLGARVDDEVVQISVKDNGIGLSPSALGDIFGMFTQGADERGRAEGGLGIGLALVEGLVDLHGGSVAVRSDGLGHGSEFVVTLPRRSRPAAPDAQPPAARATRSATVSRKILIADDNQDAANSLAMLLRLAGHDVCTAHGGQAALALAGTFHPDIALLDIGMPDLSGYEVAKQLRQTAWGKDARLVALTGWGQEDDKRRARDAGFDDHLTKPVDPRRLQSLLSGGADASSQQRLGGSRA